MSELTQRIHRFMTPEAQDSNSREFNALISILNDLRGDMRDVASKVDKLKDTVGALSGDLKTVKAEMGHLQSDVGKNTNKIDRLEQKKSNKWSGGFKPWNGKSGDDTAQIVTVMKYVGVAIGGLMLGVGSLVAAWQQMTPVQPKVTVTPPPHYAPEYNEPNHNPDSDVSVGKEGTDQ